MTSSCVRAHHAELKRVRGMDGDVTMIQELVVDVLKKRRGIVRRSEPNQPFLEATSSVSMDDI